MKTDKITFAIIGCGQIGKRHAEHISKIGILKAVCDIQFERALDVGAEYECTAYEDIDALLKFEKVDVITICTPNGLHAEHTIKALRAGFHVLCEKPMAINLSDCEAMINESLKANKRLFIVKQNRFNPPVVAIKKALDERRFGRIFSIQLNCFWNRSFQYYNKSDWKGTKDSDGGVLFTQFSHFIDLLYWFFGDVKEVYSFAENYNHSEIDFEDSGVVILKFHNGIIGTINFTINSYKKNIEGSLTIFGETGTVKIGGQYLNELEYQNIIGYKIENLPPGNPPNKYDNYVGSMSNHDKVFENIIEVLSGKGIIATNGMEGLKTVEIIKRIYESKK